MTARPALSPPRERFHSAFDDLFSAAQQSFVFCRLFRLCPIPYHSKRVSVRLLRATKMGNRVTK
jgi:hypothetical protein